MAILTRNPTVEKNNYMVVRKAALTVMERLVYSADNVEDRSLGSIYVLTALTLVSREAAETYLGYTVLWRIFKIALAIIIQSLKSLNI